MNVNRKCRPLSVSSSLCADRAEDPVGAFKDAPTSETLIYDEGADAVTDLIGCRVFV